MRSGAGGTESLQVTKMTMSHDVFGIHSLMAAQLARPSEVCSAPFAIANAHRVYIHRRLRSPAH